MDNITIDDRILPLVSRHLDTEGMEHLMSKIKEKIPLAFLVNEASRKQSSKEVPY